MILDSLLRVKLTTLAKISPAIFASIASKGNFLLPKHIKYIDKRLVALTEGKLSRLIINLPPRHGKSEFISKYFPLWYLYKYPSKRIIIVTYNQKYASRLGERIIEAHKSTSWLTKLTSKKVLSSTKLFFPSNNGSISLTGAMGTITGKGADLIIVDDPIKNDQESMSALKRDTLWRWFNSTLLTRLEPNGKVIIVMTRWNEDDLAGRIINTPKSTYEVVKLPAIAMEDDLLARVTGSALWESRYSIAELTSIKENLGSYWFSALYQQTPNPTGGGIFKKQSFKYYSIGIDKIIVITD